MYVGGKGNLLTIYCYCNVTNKTEIKKYILRNSRFKVVDFIICIAGIKGWGQKFWGGWGSLGYYIFIITRK